MTTSIKNIHLYLLVVLTLVFAAILPGTLFADSETLSCEFTVTSAEGSVTTNKATSILLKKGDSFTLDWKSYNASKAQNSNGTEIALSGSVVRTPKTDVSYTYSFFKGSKKTTCSVAVHLASGEIDSDSLVTKVTKPKIYGEAVGTKNVYFTVAKKDDSKILFKSKVVKVAKGKWSATVTKKLANGEYDIVLYGDKKYEQNKLSSEVLTIGKVAQSEATVDTTLVVESLPLLVGGTAKAGTLVPFSYLQILNIGKKPAVLTGFNVSQIGSTPVSFLQSLSSVDDSGLINNKIEGVSGKSIFKDGKAVIPTKITLEPGAMHLFTLKTALVPNVAAAVGTELKLQVTDVKSTAKIIRGSFPIRPVTWTIVN